LVFLDGITGDSTDKQFPKSVDVTSVAYGVPGGTHIARGGILLRGSIASTWTCTAGIHRRHLDPHGRHHDDL
jgi:hypothetical protein